MAGSFCYLPFKTANNTPKSTAKTYAEMMPAIISNHLTAIHTKNQAKVAFDSGRAELIPQARSWLIQVMYSMNQKLGTPTDIQNLRAGLLSSTSNYGSEGSSYSNFEFKKWSLFYLNNKLGTTRFPFL